ncbi:E1 ubiquitin-activating protein AOS1 [Aspergillus undulatus]|uniref:E1 ubiquitin-activating protein AOS1 n=1 Tax=Aspergillus undulatus TaxID=1810928 RepID=UPI003CCDEB42
MEPQDQSISADEIALYDRQIRLWGVKAQEKIRSANILLITFKALANEIAKNLVLAGVRSLTIIDDATATEEDLGAQFFLTADCVGQNRAQAAVPAIREMNPRVKVFADASSVATKPPDFFGQFDVTIATELDFSMYNTINAACRIAGRSFYAAGLHGFYGFVFSDLIQHDFVIERAKSNVPSATQETPTRRILNISIKKNESGKLIEMVTKREVYSPMLLANTSPLPEEITRLPRRKKQVTPLLSCLRALWEFQKLSQGRLPAESHQDLVLFTKLARDAHQELRLDISTLDETFLRTFLQNLGSELSPVAAFLGGRLAQDVINVLGGREHPLQNLLLHDAERNCPVYALHPFFPMEMGNQMPAIPPVANPIPLNGQPGAGPL